MVKEISSKIVLTTLILSILVFLTPSAYAAGNLEWNSNLGEMTVNLNAICYGNGTFVAVGENGL